MCVTCPLHRWVSVVCFAFHEYEKIFFHVHILLVYVCSECRPKTLLYCSSKDDRIAWHCGVWSSRFEVREVQKVLLKCSTVSVYFPGVLMPFLIVLPSCFFSSFYFCALHFSLPLCILVTWFVNTQISS